MEISQRKKKILAAVVDEYIRTAEPVGSKTIAQIAGLGCSSATIRNELSELTALGYLEQPHTSAGRIPSPQGYRFYVNELMERQRVSVEEAEAINARLSEKMEQLDKLMSFYRKAVLYEGWDRYRYVNLKYKDQIVCVK